jgi:hypothetical protein
MEAMPMLLAPRPVRSALHLLGPSLVAALVTVTGLVAAPSFASVAAAPLQQDLFQCDLAGTPGVGVHQCSNWSTAASGANPGGSVTWTHHCGGGRIVINWDYHWDGAPFAIDSHVIGGGGENITVTATNGGVVPGHFWLTGRCRSA